MAVWFLEDSLKRNGDMEMASLYGEYDMEGMLIRSALGHLLVTCDVSRLELFVEGLSTRGVINGMEDLPGWDARLLNEEMLEMVRREDPETAERIETKSYYKWQEENKQALSILGQVAMELACGCLSYECIIAGEPYLDRIERQRAYNANEEPVNVKGEAENNAGGGESGASTSSPYDLKPTHSQTLSNKQMNALTDDIKVNGIQEPIKYVEYDGQMYVVNCHHRLLAAKRLGLTEVPIEKVDLPYAGYNTIEDLLWFD